MRTVEKKVYEFDELSDKAKKKAIEYVLENYIYEDYEIHMEPIVEGFCEEASEYGFDIEVKDVRYDISYSQGSGASFECGLIDLEKFMKKMGLYKNIPGDKNEFFNDVTASIESSDFHYTHKNTVHANVDWNNDEYDEICNELIDKIESCKNNLCNELYNNLCKWDDTITSEEYLKELMEINEIEFYENGTRHSD